MKRSFLAAVGLTMLLLDVQTAPARPQDSLSTIGKLLPNDVQIAVVIPSLKRLSDDVTQMLEGMDRANLLVGSRPLDQLKSVTGFNVGIDDRGSAAVVLLREGQHEPSPLFIVPVTDPHAFLSGNFETNGGGGNEYALPDGNVVYAKALTSHVAISPRSEIVENYQPGENVLNQLADALGDRAMPLMQSGEAFLLMRKSGAKAILQGMVEAAGPRAADLPVEQLEQFAEVDGAIVAFDLDPLALVVREIVRFTPESSLGKLARQNNAPTTGPNYLPSKPFYIAVAANLEAVRGHEALFGVFERVLFQPLRNVLHAQRIRQIEFAAYPSPAGVAGGLLNDAVVVMHSKEPAELKQRIKDALNELGKPNQATARQINWQERKAVEGVGLVDAYEVKTDENAQAPPIQQMVQRMVFGQMGMRGFLFTTDDAVLMTFSQRPAVLKNAIEASKNPPASLASSPVLKSMQAWLPAKRDFQLYLGLGQIAETARQIAGSFGAADQAKMPEFDPSLPPIAIGVDVIDRGMESALVIPAGVLASMIDAAVANMPQADGDEIGNSP